MFLCLDLLQFLADASCEAIWLKYLLADLNFPISHAIPLYCDNKAARDLTANPVYHARTKHIELDCHFIREKIQYGLVTVLPVSSKDNVVDILTKGLGKILHWSCSSKLDLTFAHHSSICGGANANHNAAIVAFGPYADQDELHQKVTDNSALCSDNDVPVMFKGGLMSVMHLILNTSY